MNSSKTYTAINASAGSGKTYTLVQRVLMICLAQPNKHYAISHILALTFTNKAANEMKERILNWLKAFTQEDFKSNNELKNIQDELKNRGVMVSLEDLHHRSQKVLDYILHHYSTLNIGTIDKFNSKLVRSFSYELGLAHQFNLEIQNEPFLIEAVDKMLDEIGEENQISDAFMDFVNYNLDNDERININKTLYRKAKQFVNDIHYVELKNNEDFDWNSYENNKKKLRDEINEHRKASVDIARQSLQLIERSGLKDDDFQGKSNGISVWFKKFLEFSSKKRDFPFSGSVETYRKLTASKDAAIRHSIENIIETLIENRNQIILHYIKSEKKSKILSELLPLKINKEIQDQLNLIEEENDLVLLSKFNILINENLKNEPSAFIYEKIGTQYQHFFLDEFQDTSKMQWDNIIPLKDHTVTSDGNSFTLVGDPKQSIYRFRGGDSELMLNILNKKDYSPVEVDVNVLENNWRSSKNIVDFNNQLYQFISRDLAPQHQKLFDKDGFQTAKKKAEGRVRVNLTDNCRMAEDYFEQVSNQMHNNIQECLDNGFMLKGITILCRSAKEIQRFSQLLGLKKVNYHSHEIYIKTISEKGLTLELSGTLLAVIEYLRWQMQPDNKQYLVRMLYHLNEIGRINIKDFTKDVLNITNLETKELVETYIEENYHLKITQSQYPSLNLYNYIEYYVQEFSVENKETDFLLNFLEVVYGFTQNAGLTIKDFLKYWDEEASQISVQASENIDAISMMTIHAAKGLEFPVVFLPMRNSHKDSEFSEWLAVEGLNELKSVNIKGFKKEFEDYDENAREFNESNTYKNKIDRFCVQYVATTRPVEQLFLYLERPGKTKNYLEIYDFVQTKNPNHLDEFDVYPEINQSFKKQNTTEEKLDKKMSVRLSKEHEHINNIKIATPSRNYQSTVESVRTGIFTHEILSKINSAEDVDKVLESYTISGEITRDEASRIKEKISSIILQEDLAKYFAEGLTIINEKDIMISNNDSVDIYRPDRLVKTSEGFYIIDFKTGTEKEKHETQIEKYRQVLENLGKTVLETKIIYI